MAAKSESGAETAQQPRRRLLRDVLVFQGKLFLDGLRDVALSPASLVLALVDLLSGDRSGGRFYRLLELGRRSDHWINLFGAADPPSGAADATATGEDHTARAASVDDVVGRVEDLVREQVRSGAMSDAARRAISRGLDSLRARHRSDSGSGLIDDDRAD